MSRPSQIVVVGSYVPGFFIRVNRVPLAGETVTGWAYQEPVDGGKGSNQAIAAARSVTRTGTIPSCPSAVEAEQFLTTCGIQVLEYYLSQYPRKDRIRAQPTLLAPRPVRVS